MKPTSKVPPIPEAESRENATPKEADIRAADALSSVDPILKGLWLAKPFEPEKKDA